jgi:hypothetical protein
VRSQMPLSEEDKATRIAELKQHRCHPRAADLAHAFVKDWAAFPSRASLLVSCLKSKAGEEPQAPYLLDPALQGIRLRGKKTGT